MSVFQTLTPSRCAAMIRKSRVIAALTGAGLSTAAGIPDFRGPRGLYVTRRYDPEKVFEIDGFRSDPRYFYEFCRDFVDTVKGLGPTFSHHFLARLELTGHLAGIVTQNIDMFHQLAGSRNVVELHGSCRGAACLSCRRRFEELDYDWWNQAMAASFTPPVARCPDCQGVLKPAIVFFGEKVQGFAKAGIIPQGGDVIALLH